MTKKDGGTRFCVDYRNFMTQWSRTPIHCPEFATHSGLFQFKVMPFGLAPATFERLMDRVLQGLRWTRCLVYLDDIISFGSSFSDALDNLTLIFERLRSYGLQLKSTKVSYFQDVDAILWTYRR